VTTLRVPLAEIFGADPGAGDGGRRPRWRLRRGWGDAGERAGRRWAALAWALVLIALLLTDPGRMTFDTKLGVDIDPAGFYGQLWHLWNPLEYLGEIQDQYIGYAFPMGLFYLTAHLLHVPVWLAERLWMSLLVTAAFWGLVRLAEKLGLGSRPTRLLAGAAFALWPTFTILVGSSSAGVLPGLLAPWAVLPLVRPGSARLAAARSGLVVLAMGGVNAVSTLAAIVPAGLYLLTRPGARRWVLAGWWALAVLLATAWWLGPLLYQGRYGFNFLPYIEQSANTTGTMSAAAALRGTGNWVAYLDLGQPWLTAGSVLTGSAWAVAAAAVAAATGLAGLARRDLPEALWLRGTAAVAAVWALAGYAGPLGAPLHAPVQQLLNGPLSPLRNVFKIEPALALVLALGIAHVLARAVWPADRARRATGVAAVVVLAGLALPYLNGEILQPGSFTRVPAYWQQAAGWLAAHHPDETTLVVPADSHGIYDWGQPIDEPLEPLARSPWVQRNLVPFSGGGVADLMNGAEQAIESGTATPGLAPYLARAGIRYVLVRNDLDPAQPGYTPPAVVHATLAASGFSRVAAFGPPAATGPAGQGTPLQVEAIEPRYPPVEIFQAARAAARPAGPAAVLPAASAALVDGGPAALLQLSGQGLLTPRQPAVIAGQDTSARLPVARQDVTDGLRRADTVFGLPGNNTSYTYTAAGTIPPDSPQGAGGQAPRQLLPAGTAGRQTVAVLAGAARVTASSAGSWLFEVPQGDPVNAFDGNPATAWTEASPARADGQWVQIRFSRARQLSGPLEIRLLDDIPRPVATRLVVTTAAGRRVTDTRVTGAAQPLRVPAGSTRWLRITIAAARGGTAGGPGAGISEVAIPGVRVTRFLQPAQSPAGPVPSFSFERATATSLGLPGVSPEPALDRTFTTGAGERVRVGASVTAVPGAALSALLARLGSGTPAQVRISASSTFGSLPALGAENLLDGSDLTGWVAAGPRATVRVSWPGAPREISEIQLTAATLGIAAQPTQVVITSPEGSRDLPVPADGDLRFAPLVTNQLSISFTGVMPATSVNPLLGQAQQLPVGLAELDIPALAGLSTGVPAPSAPFTLACGQGPAVTVDGRAYPTSVSGTVGDLTSLAPLPLHVCTTGAAVTLGAGRHFLTSPGTGVALAVTSLSLTPVTAAAPSSAAAPASAPASALASAPASAPAARDLRIGLWQAEHRTVTIGPGARSYLEVHQVASPGWTATLNGHALPPVTLDGWQQAFVVPAGAGGTVTMTFTPVTGYHWLLIGSVLAVCVLIAAAAWPRRRRRDAGRRRSADGPDAGARKSADGPDAGLRNPADGPDAGARKSADGPGAPAAGSRAGRAGQAGWAGYWLAVAAAIVTVALVGGLFALVVPVTLLLGWWRPRLVPWLAFAAMAVAGALTLTGLGHGPQNSVGAFGWPAQAAALTALAVALTPAGRAARRRADRSQPPPPDSPNETGGRDGPGGSPRWPDQPGPASRPRADGPATRRGPAGAADGAGG
jgi:arabinofuranan 3-O-arabinosyltransferase